MRGIGAWGAENEVDAWFREAPMLRVATTESQVGSWADEVRAAAALGVSVPLGAAAASVVLVAVLIETLLTLLLVATIGTMLSLAVFLALTMFAVFVGLMSFPPNVDGAGWLAPVRSGRLPGAVERGDPRQFRRHAVPADRDA